MQVISSSVQSSTYSLFQSMSQVSLKELEIIDLKNQNKTLEDIAEKKRKGNKDIGRKMLRAGRKEKQIVKTSFRTVNPTRRKASDMGCIDRRIMPSSDPICILF